MDHVRIGLIGTGMLGQALAEGLLRGGAVTERTLTVTNRRGHWPLAATWPGVRVARDAATLVSASDVILLCVPPAAVNELRIDATDRLVVSVMAGVSLARLQVLTGSSRVVRAMSSPAAALRLAFSPWVAGASVTDADRAEVKRLFEACGVTAEVPSEDQIELFTAMTGPVPGFVAAFAASMARYAQDRGVDPATADLAVRQLFLASGRMMAEGAARPGDHVREMIDYAGTTAAGLLALDQAGLNEVLAKGLDAAVEKTRTMSG